jgi:hypothetical protein
VFAEGGRLTTHGDRRDLDHKIPTSRMIAHGLPPNANSSCAVSYTMFWRVACRLTSQHDGDLRRRTGWEGPSEAIGGWFGSSLILGCVRVQVPSKRRGGPRGTERTDAYNTSRSLEPSASQ